MTQIKELKNIQLTAEQSLELTRRIHENAELAHYFMYSEQTGVIPASTITFDFEDKHARRESLLYVTKYNDKDTVCLMELLFSNGNLANMCIEYAYQPETNEQLAKIVTLTAGYTIRTIIDFDKYAEDESNGISDLKIVNHLRK